MLGNQTEPEKGIPKEKGIRSEERWAVGLSQLPESPGLVAVLTQTRLQLST